MNFNYPVHSVQPSITVHSTSCLKKYLLRILLTSFSMIRFPRGSMQSSGHPEHSITWPRWPVRMPCSPLTALQHRPGQRWQLRDGNYAEKRERDRKSTRLNSSHVAISYAVFCLKKKTNRHSKHMLES